ncbi:MULTISPECIES: hypothetical protein [unclassified Paludibacterium]|uniref:hypothetical protein n=1 Tax=unclassified Paludibacterium TaxID=2618429 RepID=UPI001C05DBB7|nr:hypothetical protein [Paludibacterium sp. B53371]BEV71388.1 hypothetical protein THUN1379_08700 [Paludibacterium sp. THUN1379]
MKTLTMMIATMTLSAAALAGGLDNDSAVHQQMSKSSPHAAQASNDVSTFGNPVSDQAEAAMAGHPAHNSRR